MPARVLIIPDKFKGSLTALEAAEAIAAGWRQVRPDDRLELLPMSDGGDGFGEVLARHLGAEAREVESVDAAHRRIRATWWWVRRGRLALVESARVIGLAQLPRGRHHPFNLDTFGLGAVLRAVARLRPARCLVGIGGSATNDGGFGLARSLGWRFLSSSGQPIEEWTQLPSLARVLPPARRVSLGRVEVAVDVRNRLLGLRGATRSYGPQKGLRPEDFRLAEAALRRLQRVASNQLGLEDRPAAKPGSGAAGGLGFGLHVFAGGRLVSGFECFSRSARLEQRLARCHLVITGEGAVDEGTVLMGKGVGRIARMARRFNVPCLALAGAVARPELARGCFTRLLAITPALTAAGDSLAHPAKWLRILASRAASEWRVDARAGGRTGR
jgi:glycerate kinase